MRTSTGPSSTAVLGGPHGPIGELPLSNSDMQSSGRKMSLGSSLGTPTKELLHHWFGADARAEDIAIATDDTRTSYSDLKTLSDQIARLLRRRGVWSESVVGVMFEPSLGMVAGILGVLKAGGAFLPLDPDYPPARLSYMVRDSRACALLTTKDIGTRLTDIDAPLVFIEDSAVESGEPPHSDITPENAAYVVYYLWIDGAPERRRRHASECGRVFGCAAAGLLGRRRVVSFAVFLLV